MKSTEVCSNSRRLSQGGFVQTKANFSFQIHEGLFKFQIWKTRGEFEQTFGETNLSKFLEVSQIVNTILY